MTKTENLQRHLRGKIMNPTVRKLYLEDELQEKIQKCENEHEDFKTREYHVLMIVGDSQGVQPGDSNL